MDEESYWIFLPDHITIEIISYLSQHDKYQASLVCKYWNACFHSSRLWKNFCFNLYHPQDFVQLKFLREFATTVRTVIIKVNQSEEMCREYACSVLKHFASIPTRRLENLTITFVGQNPLLYSGQEFQEALLELFGSSLNSRGNIQYCTLKEVDLSGLKMNLDQSLLYLLASNHCKTLQKLNIQNGVLVASNHPDVIKHVVSQCQQLIHLSVYGSSINDDVILAFTSPPSRRKLKVLSIFCRRDQKYAKEISSEAWISLVGFSSDVRVTLGFDHTCPKRTLSRVMKPEIPVDVLLLETGTSLSDEVRLAASFYNETLVKLTVLSPPQYDSSLDMALLFAVDCCKQLTSLHVFYVLKKETIDYILENNEKMRIRKTYTLKHFPEPSPWTPGDGYY